MEGVTSELNVEGRSGSDRRGGRGSRKNKGAKMELGRLQALEANIAEVEGGRGHKGGRGRMGAEWPGPAHARLSGQTLSTAGATERIISGRSDLFEVYWRRFSERWMCLCVFVWGGEGN